VDSLVEDPNIHTEKDLAVNVSIARRKIAD